MSLKNQVYTSPHYHVDFDYNGLCGFDTRLSFTINQKFGYLDRDVELKDPLGGVSRRFELWSPNACSIPIYPGTHPPGFSMNPPLACLRPDGSGGRYDWKVLPQYLDTNWLHHPFIRRPDVGGDRPEFRSDSVPLIFGFLMPNM